MQTPFFVKDRLQAGESLHGCWIESFSPLMTEIVAQSGYDVVMLDLEHGPGSYMDTVQLLPVIGAHECAPLIRVPSNDVEHIKRAMDIGPAGLMVPDLRTADDARRAVAACRYGPDGVRGAAPGLVRASGYGRNLEQYLATVEQGFLLIGQVESAEGADNIEAIAAVDGIDMLFIGPADLSASLGELGDFTSERFANTFARLQSAILEAGKWLGCIPFGERDARHLYRAGHHLVLSGVDTFLLRQAAEADVSNLRESRAPVRGTR